MIKVATVYLGSSLGNKPCFAQAAFQLGRELALRGVEIVYGGSNVGTMKSLADGAISVGGRVVGVFPRGFRGKKENSALGPDLRRKDLSRMIEVEDMWERKRVMEQMGDCCIALPGSFGTFDELFEYVVNRQLGYLPKPIFILNIEGYYDPLLQMFQNMMEEGFIKDYDMELVRFCQSVDDLISLITIDNTNIKLCKN